MTLSAADLNQIREMTQTQIAETVKNLTRGTGGTVIPTAVVRAGTVAGGSGVGSPITVRLDGDTTPIDATNATNESVSAGSRVLVSFVPPHGVFVTSILQASTWIDYIPTWMTTGTTAPAINNGSLLGRYMRLGQTCYFQIALQWGSTTVGGTGDFQFTLPFLAESTMGEQWIGVTKAYAEDGNQYFGGAFIGYANTYDRVVPDVIAGTTGAMTHVRNATSPGNAAGTGWPPLGGSYSFLTAGHNVMMGGLYEVAVGH